MELICRTASAEKKEKGKMDNMSAAIFSLTALGMLGLFLAICALRALLRKSPRPALAAGFYPAYPQANVILAGRTFHAAVADTLASRSQGLSGCESMADDQGMLFDFPVPMKYSFWMKDMKFPIDIVWIRGGTVADISEQVSAPAPGATFADLMAAKVKPKAAADAVLEINAGLSKKLGLKTGDAVEVVRIR